jgi:hypothetical protein
MTGDAGLAHEAAHVGRPERCDLGGVGKPSKRHAAARREMKGVEAHRRLGSGGRTKRVWGRGLAHDEAVLVVDGELWTAQSKEAVQDDEGG